MRTTERVYLRHKLNPRRYKGLTLYRVTDAMARIEAIQRAKKLRRIGTLVRVDDFEGKYAVWTSEHKIKVSVPKGRLGLDASATKYLTSLLPDFWYVVIGYKRSSDVETGYFIGVNVVSDKGSTVYLSIYEHKRFLEIYSIHGNRRGFGEGTIVMKALKKYCDAKKIGMVLRLVKNYDFFKKFRWLKDGGSQYDETYPDYFYKVSPKTKLRYLWT